jgi:hypothetical protein
MDEWWCLFLNDAENEVSKTFEHVAPGNPQSSRLAFTLDDDGYAPARRNGGAVGAERHVADRRRTRARDPARRRRKNLVSTGSETNRRRPPQVWFFIDKSQTATGVRDRGVFALPLPTPNAANAMSTPLACGASSASSVSMFTTTCCTLGFASSATLRRVTTTTFLHSGLCASRCRMRPPTLPVAPSNIAAYSTLGSAADSECMSELSTPGRHAARDGDTIQGGPPLTGRHPLRFR